MIKFTHFDLIGVEDPTYSWDDFIEIIRAVYPNYTPQSYDDDVDAFRSTCLKLDFKVAIGRNGWRNVTLYFKNSNQELLFRLKYL